MKKIFALTLLAITAASPALAYDDEMMGTMVNGRMEVRGERDVRVPDPAMDREEAEIDREKRLNRDAMSASDKGAGRVRQPYRGKLPD